VSLKVFALSNSLKLGRLICESLALPLGQVKISRFNDGEIFVEFLENVRGSDCFVLQSLYPNSSDALVELLLAIDTLKRASAGRITAVVPYFCYMRQDRKLKPRVPISFKLVANILVSSGADRVLTMDLHKGQLAGFFDIPLDNLLPLPVFVPFLQSLNFHPDTAVVSPDHGGIERAQRLMEAMRLKNLILVYKSRNEEGLKTFGMIGNCESKDVIVVDDIIDSGGTLRSTVELLRNNQARNIYCCITHGVFSNPPQKIFAGFENLEVIITNTIHVTSLDSPNLKVLDVSKLFADAIKRIHANESISELFRW
jgi:ribose-phosphate pyrophosphokinase